MTSIAEVHDMACSLEDIFHTPNRQLCAHCNAGSYAKGVHRGCCTHCAGNSGHFIEHYDGVTTTEVKELLAQYWYSERYGFFNPRKLCCNLPREYRSIVCLTFRCKKVNDVLTQDSIAYLKTVWKSLAEFRTGNPGWLKEMLRHDRCVQA